MLHMSPVSLPAPDRDEMHVYARMAFDWFFDTFGPLRPHSWNVFKVKAAARDYELDPPDDYSENDVCEICNDPNCPA